MPSPFVYGFVSYWVDKNEPNQKSAYPMATILYVGAFSLPILVTTALKKLETQEELRVKEISEEKIIENKF